MRAAPSSPPAAGTRSSLIATARQVPGVHGVAEVPAVLVLAAERGSLCAASPGTPFTSPAPFVQSKRTCAVLGFSFHECQAFVLLGGTLRYFFLKSLCEEKEQTVASSALGLSSLRARLPGGQGKLGWGSEETGIGCSSHKPVCAGAARALPCGWCFRGRIPTPCSLLTTFRLHSFSWAPL